MAATVLFVSINDTESLVTKSCLSRYDYHNETLLIFTVDQLAKFRVSKVRKTNHCGLKLSVTTIPLEMNLVLVNG